MPRAVRRGVPQALTLAEHFRELRRRLFVSAGSLIAAAVMCWFLSANILAALRQPLVASVSAGRMAAINFPTITSAFDLRLEIAIIAGIVISSPVWLYNVLAFVLPGLTPKEQRYTFGYLAVGLPMFLGGCTAGWLVLPHIVQLMVGFAGSGDSTLLDAKQYFDFAAKLVVAVGVAFVLPLVLVAMNQTGIVTGRQILRSWRLALILICLFTAIATPAADVLSMFLLAVPMLALYFAACGFALLGDSRRGRRALADDRRQSLLSSTTESLR